MNRVILIGRLVRSPEVRYTYGENTMAVARYTLAVTRKFKQRGEDDADFISCTAFGHAAEFAEKYFKKGMKIAITGRIQTGSYTDKNGQRVYTTTVIIEEQEFCESKSADTTQSSGSSLEEGFMNIPDGIDEELPFQ